MHARRGVCVRTIPACAVRRAKNTRPSAAKCALSASISARASSAVMIVERGGSNDQPVAVRRARWTGSARSQ